MGYGRGTGTKAGWIFLCLALGIGLAASVIYIGIQPPEPATAISMLALVVSILVFAVQFGQWRTAHLKVAVDLFDRRFAVLTRMEDAIAAVMQLGEVETKPFYAFTRAQLDARFLFGDEVQVFLQRTREGLVAIMTLRNIPNEAPNREAMIDHKSDAFLRLSRFYDDAAPLFLPYIGLQHRVRPSWIATM